MRIPFTKYGWPQIVVLPAVVFALMVAFLLGSISFVPTWVIVSIEIVLAVVLISLLLFFRDPYRPVPTDQNLLLAPADGRITDIDIVDENDFIGGHGDALDWIKAAGTDRTLRIGIFLSIFNAHINRAPCNAKVEKITYREGRYKNAMNPASGQVNESNNVGLARTDSPQDRLMVRQISGAIARRIVCEARQGQELASGEKFGMIKFGSRTELYVPARSDLKCLVQIGDKVKAGVTPLVRYDGSPLCGNQACQD
jgi:phosphatidylserine decarboxylase